MSLLLFLPLLALCQAHLPHNLIKTHIQKNADFSTDPCDDFYTHVCPSQGGRGTFLDELTAMKEMIARQYLEEHQEFQRFSEQVTMINVEILKQLSDSKAIFEYLGAQWSPEQYTSSRNQMLQILSGSIAHFQLKSADSTIRSLFRKLKRAVAKAMRKTPWAHHNNALEPYLSALQNLTLTTWRDVHPAVVDAILEYDFEMERCQKSLHSNNHVASAICDAIATNAFLKTMQNPNPIFDPSDLPYIFPDSTTQFNSNDKHVYIGNPFILLALTDVPADLYGSVGFSLTHEIMHTFIIDDGDRAMRHPLAPFWTNSSECVQEQSRKTCSTFGNSNCNAQMTFEEDAADLAAYRVVWEVYQRAVARKKRVEGYEALDEQQMFFYGAAVLFCDKSAANSAPNSRDVHTGFHQRVNTIMSQMDEFAKAFQCKPTDRMVRNKATHCELYGKGAPMTRKGHTGKLRINDN